MAWRPTLAWHPLVLALGLAILLALVACQAPVPAAPAATASPPNGMAAPEVTRVPAAPPATRTNAPAAPTATNTPAGARRNVAPLATPSASAGQDTAAKAIDDNPETIWSAGAVAPQTYSLTLDQPYLVDSIQLVVAQTPAGQTTHEIWVASPSGSLTMVRKLVNQWTADGDTLTIPVNPPRVVDRVMIRTVESPSFVAWREVRVFGQPPGAAAPGAAAVPAAGPDVSWPRISVSGSFEAPVETTNAGDGSGRLFVVQRAGRISVVKNGLPLDKPFLEISDRVKCCLAEQGLFSIAFPPNFASKRYFYVSYTSQPRGGKFGPVGDVVVARYHLTADPNVADPASEQIILVLPKQSDVHNGGHLAFGPKDGYLYFGTGDGGLLHDPTNQAQSLDSLYGKILRIDVESGVTPYAIPPSNPFVNKPGHRPEIWALGLRNPWTFAFDRQTGDLYIADVGENSYEEIDFQPASSHGGENYGWNVMEGAHCFLASDCNPDGLTLPVAEYAHADGCAIVGSAVYRGSRNPDMDGIFFYADLCSGRIWGLKQAGDTWQTNLLAREPFQITDIGEDEEGNLYVSDFTDNTILEITEPAPSATPSPSPSPS